MTNFDINLIAFESLGFSWADAACLAFGNNSQLKATA